MHLRSAKKKEGRLLSETIGKRKNMRNSSGHGETLGGPRPDHGKKEPYPFHEGRPISSEKEGMSSRRKTGKGLEKERGNADACAKAVFWRGRTSAGRGKGKKGRHLLLGKKKKKIQVKGSVSTLAEKRKG